MATAEYSGDATLRASETTPLQTDVTLTPISIEETLQLRPCAARVRLAYAVFSAGRFLGQGKSLLLERCALAPASSLETSAKRKRLGS